MKNRLTFLALLIFVITSMSFAQVTNLDHAGASPYATIQAAIDNAATVAGDRLSVAAGTYNAELSWPITVNKSVTIEGVGNTTIVNPGIDNDGFLITVANVTIKDLKITLSTSGVDHQAIRLQGAGTATITGNVIETTGNKGVGIWIGGVGYANSNNLTISNNTITIANESTGIYAEGGSTAQTGWLITGNTITANNGNPLELYDVTSSTVNGNTLTTTASGGANVIWSSELASLTNLVFTNNILDGSNGSQVVISSDLKDAPLDPGNAFTGSITTVHITGNTFSHWGSRALRLGAVAGVGTVTIITITTNTFQMTTDTQVIGGPATDKTGTGNIFNVNSPAKIKKAIESAFSGDNINVAAGTYNEGDVLIPIDKSLTLLGPNYLISPNGGARVAEAIIEGLNTGTANALFGVNLGSVTFIVKGFTFHTLRAEMRNDAKGATVTLEKNIFTGNRDDGMWFDDTHLTVFDNLFTGYHTTASETIAMAVTSLPRLGTISITHNTWSDITGNGALNLSDVSGSVSNNQFNGVEYYGMLVAFNTNLTISDNVFNNITNPVVVPTGNELTFGAGVRFYEPSPLTIASITSNTFSNSYLGVSVRATNGNITGATISVNNNSFTGNTSGILNAAIGTLNAANNWWGNASGPFNATTNPTGTGNSVSDNVNYSPWLGQSSNTSHPWTLTANGGDLDNIMGLLVDGDTIHLLPGTYGSFTITHSITLTGSPYALIDHTSPAITVAANNVTITGLAFSYGGVDEAIRINVGITGTIIHNCNFNVTNAINNLSNAAVNAEYNYWGFGGNFNGPTIGTNPLGTGGIITDVAGTVDYDPWVGKVTSPTNGFVGTPMNSFTITWDWPSFFGPNFVFQLDHGGGAGEDVNTTVATNSYTISTPLSNNTTYHWYVRSVADPLNVWIGPFSFTPTSNYLVSPANLSVGVSIVPTFDWSDVLGATGYTLEIATDNAFSSIVLTQAVNPSTYTLTPAQALVNGVTYYWRVTSNNVVPVVSNIRTFIVVQPSMPYLTNPVNGSTLVGNTIYFTWYVTGSSASNFVLEVDDANDFLTPIQTFSGLTTSYYSWTYTGLTPGSTYYWRVTAKTSGGVIVNYSSTWNFVGSGMPDVYPSYPTGGVTVYTNTPALYYYTGTYYNGQFEVRYATSSHVDGGGMLDQGGAASLPLTSNLFVTLPALSGTNYYWQVRSSNGVNTSAWSNVQNFVVYSSTATTPVVPYLSWPIGGATVYTNPPSFYWYLGTYSTGLEFYFEYDEDSGFGSPNGNSGWISTLNYTLPTSLASGTWYWHVKSRLASNHASESAYSSTESFVIQSSSSSIPTPTPYSPVGGATVYALNPTLTYYAYSTSALQYQINYSAWPSTDVNGVLDLANTTSVWTSSTSYILTGLIPGVTYYWQVRARLAATPATISPWSSVATFTTAAGASAVVPLVGSPNYNQSIDQNTAVLSWIIPTQSSSPLTYTVQYSNKSDMSDAVTVNNVSKPEYQLNGLILNKTYYWRVSSKNTNGSSSYSSIGVFKSGGVTDVSKEQLVLPTAFELSQNYPNPFNPTTKITYALPQNSYVSIKVYDMLGREVKTLVNTEMLAGNHNVDWNGENNSGFKVASGTYIYRITAGSFVAVKKMILIK